jgi:hypothetical protein
MIFLGRQGIFLQFKQPQPMLKKKKPACADWLGRAKRRPKSIPHGIMALGYAWQAVFHDDIVIARTDCAHDF